MVAGEAQVGLSEPGRHGPFEGQGLRMLKVTVFTRTLD